MIISALLLNIGIFQFIYNSNWESSKYIHIIVNKFEEVIAKDSWINLDIFVLDSHILIFFISVLFLMFFVTNKNK
jgi:hypothetical protein